MNVRTFMSVLLTAAFLLVGSAVRAAPVPINGSAMFMGNATPVPSSTSWFTSTGLINPVGWTVTGSTGVLSAAAGTFAQFFAFNWIPPSVGTTIWTYTAASGVTFSLSLNSVTSVTGTAIPDSIAVTGTGTLTSSDPLQFLPTLAVWNFFGAIAAQGRDVGFIGIATPGQAPEPASLALVGIALAGLGLSRRRKQA